MRIPNKWYNKQKRDKRNLVSEDMLNISNHPIKEILEKAIFETKLSTDRNSFNSAQQVADCMLTDIRTIVSKAYTELFSTTTTSAATPNFSDEDARAFIEWFNSVVAAGLENAGDLVIEHRNELRKMGENE